MSSVYFLRTPGSSPRPGGCPGRSRFKFTLNRLCTVYDATRRRSVESVVAGICSSQMGGDGHASSKEPVAGAEHRDPGSAGAAGPVVAHVILVGSWVAPPVMLLAGGIAAGWPFGIPGAAAGTALTGALFVGPASRSYRGALCSGLCALAMAAGEGNRGALLAAGSVAVLTAALHVRWRTSERFYSLITQTLRGKDYYAAAEVRGAIDTVRPGRNFYAVHPHGCLSAGWTWNVSADRPLPPCLCLCVCLAVANRGLDPGRMAQFGDRVQSRAHSSGVCTLAALLEHGLPPAHWPHMLSHRSDDCMPDTCT